MTDLEDAEKPGPILLDPVWTLISRRVLDVDGGLVVDLLRLVDLALVVEPGFLLVDRARLVVGGGRLPDLPPEVFLDDDIAPPEECLLTLLERVLLEDLPLLAALPI